MIMKPTKLNLSKFFPGGDFSYPSYFEIKGGGTDKADVYVDVCISTGRNLVNFSLGEYDKQNFKFIQELHTALSKTLDYYETMAQIAVVTNPAIPVVSKKTKGVLKSTETKPKK